ncbi:RyR domain-containing protein [Glycocaulis abyssi]|uniref:RyR domain-containing protein n=1 Tax=Glycocaulis abyssi TaxID=1433403 RepID=A0ABV9NFE2_9PROT
MRADQSGKTDIETIARVCHEAVRAYCEALGETALPPWDEAEDWQVEATLAAVCFRVENPDASPGDQHQQWMEEKRRSGWQFGHTRNDHLRTHPMMVPFEALPATEKRKDLLFQRVVDALSGEI